VAGKVPPSKALGRTPMVLMSWVKDEVMVAPKIIALSAYLKGLQAIFT
jgi:hypothetical protein